MNILEALIKSFTSREWAILFWLSIFIIWAGKNKSIRNSVTNVIKIFFNTKILSILLLMTIYVVFLFLFLNYFHLIKLELLKDYLYWYFGFAFVSLFSINIFRGKENYFKNIVKELFKVFIVIEFLVNFYTFPFILELFFIPFITLISMMIVYTEAKKEYGLVKKVLNWILGIIGLWLITYIVYRITNAPESLITIENILSILTPIILGFLFLPFLYLVMLYMTYEELFVRIDILLKRTPEFKKSLKFKVLFQYNLRLFHLTEFIDRTRLELTKINTKDDIDNLFNLSKTQP